MKKLKLEVMHIGIQSYFEVIIRNCCSFEAYLFIFVSRKARLKGL